MTEPFSLFKMSHPPGGFLLDWHPSVEVLSINIPRGETSGRHSFDAYVPANSYRLSGRRALLPFPPYRFHFSIVLDRHLDQNNLTNGRLLNANFEHLSIHHQYYRLVGDELEVGRGLHRAMNVYSSGGPCLGYTQDENGQRISIDCMGTLKVSGLQEVMRLFLERPANSDLGSYDALITPILLPPRYTPSEACVLIHTPAKGPFHQALITQARFDPAMAFHLTAAGITPIMGDLYVVPLVEYQHKNLRGFLTPPLRNGRCMFFLRDRSTSMRWLLLVGQVPVPSHLSSPCPPTTSFSSSAAAEPAVA